MGFGGFAAHLGIGAGAKATGGISSNVEFDVGVGHQQRLCIGVDGDEFDTADTGVDHAIDGIDTAAADTGDFDDG